MLKVRNSISFVEFQAWESTRDKSLSRVQLFGVSRTTVCVTPRTVALLAPLSMGILQARKLEWFSMPFFQGIFPTQGPNPGLPYCRWILYHLSHQGSSWILKWVANPFSRGSSLPRNWTRISCIAGIFFTSWATREALSKYGEILI